MQCTCDQFMETPTTIWGKTATSTENVIGYQFYYIFKEFSLSNREQKWIKYFRRPETINQLIAQRWKIGIILHTFANIYNATCMISFKVNKKRLYINGIKQIYDFLYFQLQPLLKITSFGCFPNIKLSP